MKKIILTTTFACIVIISACLNKSERNSSADSSATVHSEATDTTVAGTDAGKPSENWLLVPGVSAGQTNINENAEDVMKRLGKPDGGDAAMGKAVSIWYTHHDSTAHSIAIYSSRNMGNDETPRVKQIRVTSPSFSTEEDIHTGSSLSDIEKKFTVKKAEAYKDAGVDYAVYDSEKGIAFEIGPDSKSTAIIIHEPGITGSGSYQKFRTTDRFVK